MIASITAKDVKPRQPIVGGPGTQHLPRRRGGDERPDARNPREAASKAAEALARRFERANDALIEAIRRSPDTS